MFFNDGPLVLRFFALPAFSSCTIFIRFRQVARNSPCDTAYVEQGQFIRNVSDLRSSSCQHCDGVAIAPCAECSQELMVGNRSLGSTFPILCCVVHTAPILSCPLPILPLVAPRDNTPCLEPRRTVCKLLSRGALERKLQFDY